MLFLLFCESSIKLLPPAGRYNMRLIREPSEFQKNILVYPDQRATHSTRAYKALKYDGYYKSCDIGVYKNIMYANPDESSTVFRIKNKKISFGVNIAPYQINEKYSETQKTYLEIIYDFMKVDQSRVAIENLRLEAESKVYFDKVAAKEKMEIDPSYFPKGTSFDERTISKTLKQMEASEDCKFYNSFYPLLYHPQNENISKKLLDHMKLKSDEIFCSLVPFCYYPKKDFFGLYEDYLEDYVWQRANAIQKQTSVPKGTVPENYEVFAETKKLNPNQIQFIEGELRPLIEKTKYIYDKEVKNWNEKDLKRWGSHVRRNPAGLNRISKVLAVLMRTAELSHGYIPRDTQLLSVLSCLSQSGRGQFLQVKTGEGKSLITAMLSASQVLLYGTPVDVLSSSEILADRDGIAGQKFFDMLSIKADYLSKKKDEKMKQNKEYKEKLYREAHVIYSDISSMVFDLLLQTYHGKKTRCNRPFGCLVIDEVDNLIVDCIRHCCRLQGDTLAGSESLMPFLQLLWLKYQQLEKSITEVGNGCYKNVITNDVFKNKDFYIRKEMEAFGNAILDGTYEDFRLPIDPQIKSFARMQLSNWIDSARKAYQMQEGKDYIYTKNENPNEPGLVEIVDYENTGNVQKGMQWSSGLHQFVQLKHSGCFTPESLSSCFMSQLGYLSLYKTNVFGLTGTLGDQATREFIKDTYNVGLMNIPTYKPKKFTELPGILCEDADSWEKTIVKRIKEEAGKGRGILVINETIADCEKVQEALSRVYPSEKVRMYHRSDKEEQEASVSVNVSPGDVILSTNLGGRGTDLKTLKAVEEKGGLHVIVTFLPKNQRVEDQAFGRTSRQGNNGTAQLILDISKTLEFLHPFIDKVDSIKDFKEMREKKEADRILDSKNLVLKENEINDELYHDVEKFVQKLRGSKETHEHEDSDKLSQLEQLWSLQYHRLSNYKKDFYDRCQRILVEKLDQYGLKVSSNPFKSLDALYKALPFPMEEIRYRVFKYLLGQREYWQESDLNNFAEGYFDTRTLPDIFYEALCQVTNRTYVCISHNGSIKIYRNKNSNAPVVYIGMIDGKSMVSQLSPNISILSELYPKYQFSGYPSVSSSQIDNLFFCVRSISGEISESIRSMILCAPCVVLESPYFDKSERYIEGILEQVADYSNKKHENVWGYERDYLKKVVKQFINDVKYLYETGYEILLIPSYLSQRAQKSEYPTAMWLFKRACESGYSYRAMSYYDKAHYLIEDQGNGYKTRALESFEECEKSLVDIVGIWQYISVFAMESEENSPIKNQAKARMSVYEKLLSNIHENINKLRAAKPQDEIKVNKDKYREIWDLTESIPNFNRKDAMQLMSQGLTGLNSYDLIKPPPPKKSFFDVLMVNLLGTVQTVVGTVLTAVGMPSIGLPVIANGIIDLWNGVKSTFSEGFSWEGYFFDKAISVVTMAVGKAYGAVKGMISATKTAAVEVAKSSARILAEKTAMKAIVDTASKTLIQKAQQELCAKAAREVVFSFKQDIKNRVEHKIKDLLTNFEIRKTVSFSIVVSGVKLINEVISNVARWIEKSGNRIYEIMERLVSACTAQHHVSSSLSFLIETISKGISLTKYTQDAMQFVDQYIAKIEEEIFKIKKDIPTISEYIKINYKAHNTAVPSVLGEFIEHLQKHGIIRGDRPYLLQTSQISNGIVADKDTDQMISEVMPSYKEQFRQKYAEPDPLYEQKKAQMKDQLIRHISQEQDIDYNTFVNSGLSGLFLSGLDEKLDADLRSHGAHRRLNEDRVEEFNTLSIVFEVLDLIQTRNKNLSKELEELSKMFVAIGTHNCLVKASTATDKALTIGVDATKHMFSELRTSICQINSKHEKELERLEALENPSPAPKPAPSIPYVPVKKPELSSFSSSKTSATESSSKEQPSPVVIPDKSIGAEVYADFFYKHYRGSEDTSDKGFDRVGRPQNRNEGSLFRAITPPGLRLKDTYFQKTGRVIVEYTPQIVKNTLSTSVQAMASAAHQVQAWGEENYPTITLCVNYVGAKTGTVISWADFVVSEVPGTIVRRGARDLFGIRPDIAHDLGLAASVLTPFKAGQVVNTGAKVVGKGVSAASSQVAKQSANVGSRVSKGTIAALKTAEEIAYDFNMRLLGLDLAVSKEYTARLTSQARNLIKPAPAFDPTRATTLLSKSHKGGSSSKPNLGSGHYSGTKYVETEKITMDGSKKIWQMFSEKNKPKIRMDVESIPGYRKSNLHVHAMDGEKYYYDVKTDKFYKNIQTKEGEMPKSILKELNKMPKFQEKFEWALKNYLGIKR